MKRINHFSRWLNDIRIKKKLVIIFFFCVLIPMIIINYLIILLVGESADSKTLNTMENTAQRIEYNLNRAITSAENVAQQFENDKVLNNFLNKYYRDNLDYYENYYQLKKDNAFSFYYQSESVYRISLFTNNDTVVRSASFYTFEDAKGEPWYNKVMRQEGKGMFLSSYYSNDVIRKPFNDKLYRKISVICRFSNYLDIVKVLKLDLSYDELQTIIFNEKTSQDIIITKGNDILFDTRGPRLEYISMQKLEPIDENLFVVNHPVKLIDEEWNIMVLSEKNRFFDNYKENKVLLWVIILLVLFLPSIVIVMVGTSLTRRIKLTEQYLQKVKDGEYDCIDFPEGRDEIGELIRSYNIMVNRVRELIEVVLKGQTERQTLELLKNRAELHALQSQINPHFMFNALESIRMKSFVNGDVEIANIIGELALYMRSTIQWKEDFITLQEEITFIKGYLKIQKYRFGERLNFSVHVQPDCESIRIPKFGILTFVENSCIHGIEKKIEGGSIDIIIMREDMKMYVEIMDTGMGMEKDKLQEIHKKIQSATMEHLIADESIGIMNVVIRLNTYYQDRIEWLIESKLGEGTDVYFTITLQSESE